MGMSNYQKVHMANVYEKRTKIWLVGGTPTPLKNMKVNWDDYSQYMEKMFQTTNQLASWLN